jgi:hypothetical protein
VKYGWKSVLLQAKYGLSKEYEKTDIYMFAVCGDGTGGVWADER